MECELRKCYQDYLYNNSKLADYIMADAASQRLQDNETSLAMQESIQQAIRRRSITPPPKYDRIDLTLENSHQSIRKMANGSTSTIASLLSSNSSHSATTNSSTSSTSPSAIFRTHRFIPNIISHQAQKMAQHFELKKFRSNAQHGGKKDSLSRQQEKGSQQHLSENQTMLSFLFSLSNSSSSLKRSESASNIHRINTNILLPKHLLQMSTEPNSPSSNRSPTSDRHLIPQHQPRKHSINEGVPTDTSHQTYQPLPTLKQTVDSKAFDDHHSSDTGTLRLHQSQQSSNSPKKQTLKTNSSSSPPPLPPKTYNRGSNSTTTSSSSSLNNSGRSSIASNTSTMSSSSLNMSKDTNLRNCHSRMKDCDSGFGSSTSGMPSNSNHYQQPIEKQNSIDFACRNFGKDPKTVKAEVTAIVSNTQDSGYSQVTLRSKKNNRRNRTRTIHDSVADDENNNCTTASSSHTIVELDGNNETERCSSSSPPPLPAPDSFLCSAIETHDSLTNKNIMEEKENSEENIMHSYPNQNAGSSPTSECCCCCCSNRSMIRTYRKPGTNRRPLSMHQPLIKSRSLAVNTNNSMLNRQPNSCCCCSTQIDESHRQQLPRRPSLSMHETPSLSPPPLPPKRNLHAYMGMVGNYCSPTVDHSGHTTLRATKSMFCEKPSPLHIKNHHNSQASSSNSSISTATTCSSFSSITDRLSQPHDTSIVDPTDQYEHLPMAPSPPPESPLPNLPPRRGQVIDLLPPPIRSRSTATNTQATEWPIAISSSDHVQPHCQHHHPHHDHNHHHHHHKILSINPIESNNQHDHSTIIDQQRSTIEELDESSSDNDEESIVDETNRICSYCSLGTNHSEDECILAQVDISSEMFTLETTTDSEGSSADTQAALTTNSSELITTDMIRGGQIDALIIKATQASMDSG